MDVRVLVLRIRIRIRILRIRRILLHLNILVVIARNKVIWRYISRRRDSWDSLITVI